MQNLPNFYRIDVASVNKTAHGDMYYTKDAEAEQTLSKKIDGTILYLLKDLYRYDEGKPFPKAARPKSTPVIEKSIVLSYLYGHDGKVLSTKISVSSVASDGSENPEELKDIGTFNNEEMEVLSKVFAILDTNMYGHLGNSGIFPEGDIRKSVLPWSAD